VSRTRNIISFSIAALLVGTFFFFNRSSRRTYQAFVALDGKEPFGPIYPGSSDTLVLYRQGLHGVTCFDAFHSKELHDRFSPKDGQAVTVEYDTLIVFGRIKGYNVHRIDGFILANGARVLRPDFAATAGVSAWANNRGDHSEGGNDDCW